MRKTLLSMFAIGLAAMPFQSNAITVDDLDGKVMCYIHSGNNPQFGAPQWTNAGRFEKNANGGIDIVGFYSEYRIPATIQNNCLVINRGSYTSAAGTGRVLTIGKANLVVNTTINGYYGSGYSRPVTSGTLVSNQFETVSANGMTYSRFRFSYTANNVMISLQLSDPTTSYAPTFAADINIAVVEPNAVAELFKDGESKGKHPVRITEDNGKLEIQNYLNAGLFFENTVSGSTITAAKMSWADGTVDSDGNCTLYSKINSGTTDVAYYGYVYYSGYNAYWYSREVFRQYQTYLTASSGSSKTNITGKRTTSTDGNVAHQNYDKNAWVKADGGAVSTTGGATVYTFNTSNIYSQMTGNTLYGYDKVVITAGEGGDCTHDVKMQINEFDFNPRNGHLKTTVTTHSHKNFDNVDYYDLYIVPGTYTSAADAGFKHHFEKGHEDAALVKAGCIDTAMEDGEIITNYITVAPHTNDALKGLGLEDVAALDDDPEPVKKPYTLFLKAHYKPETGLEPTFHALATQLTTTGLEDLEAKSEEAAISAATGMIVIDGSDAVAEVYTTSGALVYAGADREIAVSAGLYIVRVGNQTAKVVVK